MKITIDIDPHQHAELLRIAATPGETGVSTVVREAVDYYLAHHAGRAAAVRAALGVRGALGADEADALMDEVRRIRANWRS